MNGTMRASLAAINALIALIGVGCASRPGIETRLGLATLESYNGHWVLQETHGPPSGGFRFESRKGKGGQPDPEAFAVVLKASAERFTLELNDLVFRVSESEPGPSFTLPMDGGRVQVRDEGLSIDLSIRLTWSGDTPVIERLLPDRSVVLDRYELAANGTLVVTRTARLGAMESGESVRFVYRRSDTPASSFSSGSRQEKVPGGAE